MITVKELMNRLSKLDSNLYVAVSYDEDYNTCFLEVGHKHEVFNFLVDGENIL